MYNAIPIRDIWIMLAKLGQDIFTPAIRRIPFRKLYTAVNLQSLEVMLCVLVPEPEKHTVLVVTPFKMNFQ